MLLSTSHVPKLLAIPARNTADRYGSITIWLHWLNAFAIFALLATAAWAWGSPTDAVEGDRLRIHGAVGIAAYLLIVARIVWHFVERTPRSLTENPALRVLAKTVHIALLVLVAFQLLSGPIDVWTGGWPIDVFGWFAIPSPFGTALKPLHDAIGTLHRYCGYTIAVVVALHFLAAGYHWLVGDDEVVPRMLGMD